MIKHTYREYIAGKGYHFFRNFKVLKSYKNWYLESITDNKEKTDIRGYLEKTGFKTYRENIIKNKPIEFVPSNDLNMTDDTFTTMVSGGLCIFYINGKKIVCYGLHEFGKPPSLISPRPKYKTNIDLSELTPQDITNRLIKKYTNEEIYNAMFNEDYFLEL